MTDWYPYEIDIEEWQQRAAAAGATVELMSAGEQATYLGCVQSHLDAWFGDIDPIDELVEDGLIDDQQFVVLITIQELAVEQVLNLRTAGVHGGAETNSPDRIWGIDTHGDSDD
jgi:hypothetical protein